VRRGGWSVSRKLERERPVPVALRAPAVARTPASKTARASTRTLSPTDLLWRRFKSRGDELARNQLIEQYLSSVRYIAERIFAKLPRSVDFDDVLSAGIFGLIHAVNNFDPQRGTKFETYCTARIRGAIIDELRNLDWIPRLIRARAARIQAAFEKLEVELGREPTDGELADEMEVTPKRLAELMREASAVTLMPFDRRTDDSDLLETGLQLEILEDKKGSSPPETIGQKELVELIHDSLTPQERLIVILYYYDELTLREIGIILEISESRVCQILARVVLRTKSRFEKHRVGASC